MSFELVTTYSGIDDFGQEVFLCTEQHQEITDKLRTFALHNVSILRGLVCDAPQLVDEETVSEPDFEAGHLLIYFYFADWLEGLEVEEDDFCDDKVYPCWGVLPEEIGMTKAQVLAVLNFLTPVEGETQAH
jgi:hypothetical protein